MMRSVMRRLPWLLLVLAIAGAVWMLRDTLWSESGVDAGVAGSGESNDAQWEELKDWEAEWDAAEEIAGGGNVRLGGHGRVPAGDGKTPGTGAGGKESGEGGPRGAVVRFGGVVNGPDGRPAGGVRILIGGGGGPLKRIESEPNGRFKTELPAGRYDVVLKAEGIGGLALPQYLVDGAVGTELELTLQRLVTLTVAVKRQGEPIEAAAVGCSAHRGIGVAAAMTDADGRAVFEELVVARYQISIVPPTGETISRRTQIRKDMELAVDLPRGIAIWGTVTDGDGGGPLAGAEVRASVRGPARTVVQVPATSGTDGRYEMEVPQGRVVKFEAMADGFASWPERRQAGRILGRLGPVRKGRPVELGLTLVRGLLLTGTVTEEGGDPVGGIKLHLVPRRGLPLAATTADDGSYRVEGIRPDRYGVVVMSDGWFNEKNLRVVVPPLDPGSAHTFDFEIFRTLEIEGEVVHGDESPALGARVWVTGGGKLLRSARRGGRVLETFTDERGWWRIDDLPPKLNVAARAALGPMEAAPRSFRTDNIPGKPLRLVLSPTVNLKGRVLDQATREFVAQARVDIRPEGEPNNRTFRRVFADAEGTFEATELIPGTWRLTPYHRDFLKAEPLGVDLAAGDGERELTLYLDPGLAIGGVVTDESGTPLAKASVTVSGRDRDGVASRWRRARTGSRGRFRITGYALGTYSLRASSSGYRSTTMRNLRGGEERLHVQLKARPARK